jgi:hypothetical protein
VRAARRNFSRIARIGADDCEGNFIRVHPRYPRKRFFEFSIMKTNFRLLLVIVFCGLAFVGGAAEAPTEAVVRLDAARLEAMRAGDGAALGRIFSEEILFVHSDGRAEGKGNYITAMTAGDTAYADLKSSDLTVRQIAPEVIVLTGAQEMKKKLGPTWSEIRLRFMSVWRVEAGAWRMVAWQSMKPAGNSIVPATGTEKTNANAQAPKKAQ